MNIPIYCRNIGEDLTEEIDKEVARAVAKHGEFNSLHEAYGVLLEEVDELWEIVREKRSVRDPNNLRAELVQICACAIKAVHSIENFTGEGTR
jgi:hypothetical protein